MPWCSCLSRVQTDRFSSVTLAQDDHDTIRASTDTTRTKRSTPSRLSPRDGAATAKTAVSSLRQQLSRHSRTSKRGSVSEVFRRTGSNASSLRGAKGPDAYYRNSVDLGGISSPLTQEQEQNKDKDSATSIPLPSSPIAIPSPQLPTLKLDFGPPALLSPFEGMKEADLADIKVLQDPKNITCGVPSSHHLPWDCGKQDPRVVEHRNAATAASSTESGLKTASSQLAPFSLLSSPFVERDDPFGRESPMPGTTLCLEVDDATKERPNETLPSYGDCIRPAGMDLGEGSTATTKHGEEAAGDVENSKKQNKKEYPPSSPLAVFQFEEPASGAHCNKKRHNENSNADLVNVLPTQDTKDLPQPSQASDSMPPPAQLYPGIIQRIGGPGPCMLAGDAKDGRSDSLRTQVPDSPRSDKDCDLQDALEGFKAVETGVNDCEENGSTALRKDSLIDNIEQTIHQHGPPSPTRTVRLPLRPKAPLTKPSSHDSMIFRPILDRLAAKKLGILRPGSDPTLRQRYYPHVLIDASNHAQFPRQTSLDSRGSKTSEESNDNSGIFERAVEPVSPLHIRKQSGVSPAKNAPSPRTPKDNADPQTPGSSPYRTPSMGDRQLFEMQRAERNARYNAIHSGSCVFNGDFDFQLADFDHAGPGSRGSTPGRNSMEGGSEGSVSPSRSERAVPA